MHKARSPEHAPGAIHYARAYELASALAFAGSRRRIWGRLVALAEVTAGDEVLDVGCGPGYLTSLAAQAAPGGRAVGVDVSEPMIAEATRKRAGANCSFMLGKAEALDLPDASFDVVLSSLAIHHIPEDARAQAFAEMFRVLRPGGRALIADFRPAGQMLGDAGFRVGPTARASWFLHCVRADKPADSGL